MPDQKLKEPLLRLKEALKEIDPADAETRDLLKKLIGHLEEKENTSHQAQEHKQLLKILKEKVVYFENVHPVVGGTIEEIIGILSRMGI
jgi:hypothetical protein